MGYGRRTVVVITGSDELAEYSDRRDRNKNRGLKIVGLGTRFVIY